MQLPPLNYKKIFQIIAFLAATVLFTFLLYIFFFRAPAIEPDVNINVNGDVGPGRNITDSGSRLPRDTNANAVVDVPGYEQPDQSKSTLRTLTDVRIRSMRIEAEDGDVLYYNRDDGKFYRIDANGNSEPISDQVFYQAENIVWSPNQERILVEYPDGANIAYDFKEDKQITLPADWEELEFTNTGQIIGKNFSEFEDQNLLLISDLDSGNTRIIENMGYNIDNVTVMPTSDNQILAILTETDSFSAQELYFIGRNNENFASIQVDGIGFEGKWSPNGKQLLYSVFGVRSDWEPELWIVNRDGSGKKQLGLHTWSFKCAFYDDTIAYCAVPQELNKMAGLDSSYSAIYDDNIYRVDLTSLQAEFITTPANGHSIKAIAVSPDERFIYFTDYRDGLLYQLEVY